MFLVNYNNSLFVSMIGKYCNNDKMDGIQFVYMKND